MSGVEVELYQVQQLLTVCLSARFAIADIEMDSEANIGSKRVQNFMSLPTGSTKKVEQI